MGHARDVAAAAFSPNGKLIAKASLDATARLWDATTAAPVGLPLKHTFQSTSLAFNRSGTVLLTGAGDQTARFWDVATGQQLDRPSLRHRDYVRQVAFRSDGQLLTVESNGSVRIWPASALVDSNPIGSALPHLSPATAQFSPDGRSIATLDLYGCVRVWDAEPAALGYAYCNHGPGAFSYSPGGWVVGRTNPDVGTLQVQRVAAGRAPAPVGQPITPPGPVSHALVSRDGKTLLTRLATDSRLHLWDVENGAQRGSIADEIGRAFSVAFHADSWTILITRQNLAATVYDTRTLKPRCTLQGPAQGDVNNYVALSADGKLAATGGYDGVVRLWDTATGERFERKMEHGGPVTALAFSDDGKYLLTGSNDRTARLWHVDSGKLALPPLSHGTSVTAVAISPDGKTLQTCQDSAQLWDASTGRTLGPPSIVAPASRDLSFAQDGKTYLARFSLGGRVPQPVPGDVQRLKLWVEVLTGMEMDDDGVFSAFDGAQWQERRQRLELLGGPP